MKKRMKPLIALGLALAMLCGCGSPAATSDTGKETTAGGTEAGGSTEAGESTAAAEAIEYPDYINLDSQRPIVKDGEEITLKVFVARRTSRTTLAEDSWFVKFLEEKMNIKLDIEEIAEGSLDEKKALMLASNDLPDMLFNFSLTTQEMVQYCQDGELFLPMNQYINETLTPNIVETLKDQERAVSEATMPNGNLYALPGIFDEDPALLGWDNTMINKKYLEAAGYEEQPKTLDEFLDMLRAFKKLDPAQFGVDEIWPYVGVNPDPMILQKAFGWTSGNGYVPSWDAQEQTMVVPFMTEKWGEYLNVMNTMYKEGLIHPDYLTMDPVEMRAYAAEGAVPVFFDWGLDIAITDREQFFDWDYVQPIGSQWCEKPISCSQNMYTQFMSHNVWISADTEYPELCMRLLDYFYSPEGATYMEHGCPAGSEDTLGMIEGYSLADDGSIYEPQMAEGDGYGLSQWDFDDRKVNQFRYESLGEEYTGLPELNPEDPVDYLDICKAEKQGPYLVADVIFPFMDQETTEEYTDLLTVLTNYAKEESAKFVVGQRSLDEFDDYLATLKEMGADELKQIIDTEYADYIAERLTWDYYLNQ